MRGTLGQMIGKREELTEETCNLRKENENESPFILWDGLQMLVTLISKFLIPILISISASKGKLYLFKAYVFVAFLSPQTYECEFKITFGVII